MTARREKPVGLTADAGWQIGVRRTVSHPAERLWELLTERPEVWLGDGVSVAFDRGEAYEVPARDGQPGVSGRIGVVRPGHRLRMTWQPDGWAQPATLQITLLAARTGTTVAVHLDRLADAAARERMRAHWTAVIERIDAAAIEDRS